MMEQMTAQGRAIECASFAIIDQEVGAHSFGNDEWQIVRRVIHATGDFEFKELMQFHPRAIGAGLLAIAEGAPLIVDVRMVLAGINPERIARFGVEAYCYISDPDVIRQAKAQQTTRAKEAMLKAHRARQLTGAIVVVGNTPTSLLELLRLIREEGVKPALVIGMPVGFVAADESKDKLIALGSDSKWNIPFIVSRGRKGGSSVAVATLHALLKIASQRGRE